MHELMLVFSLYIQSLTGMSTIPPGDMPYVEHMSVCDMTAILEGPQAECSKDGPKVAALYLITLNRIVLEEDADLNTARDASVFLHELVHAQQTHDVRMYRASCIEKEKQAYAVQMQWLKQVAKLDPAVVIGTDDPGTGAVWSCGGK